MKNILWLLASSRRKFIDKGRLRLSKSIPKYYINSLPKSGTHLLKAYLIAAGEPYFGHINDVEAIINNKRVRKRPNTQGFVTGHSLMNNNIDYNILLWRDPVDVLYSMVRYIKSRPDHRLYFKFKNKKDTDIFIDILEGRTDIGLFSNRYKNFYEWAKHHKAIILDYEEIKNNPSKVVSELLGAQVNRNKLNIARNKWNPTKRRIKPANENNVKSNLKELLDTKYSGEFDVYYKKS